MSRKCTCPTSFITPHRESKCVVRNAGVLASLAAASIYAMGADISATFKSPCQNQGFPSEAFNDGSDTELNTEIVSQTATGESDTTSGEINRPGSEAHLDAAELKCNETVVDHSTISEDEKGTGNYSSPDMMAISDQYFEDFNPSKDFVDVSEESWVIIGSALSGDIEVS